MFVEYVTRDFENMCIFSGWRVSEIMMERLEVSLNA